MNTRGGAIAVQCSYWPYILTIPYVSQRQNIRSVWTVHSYGRSTTVAWLQSYFKHPLSVSFIYLCYSAMPPVVKTTLRRIFWPLMNNVLERIWEEEIIDCFERTWNSFKFSHPRRTHNMKNNLREADSCLSNNEILRLALSFPQTSMTDLYLKAIGSVSFLHALELKVHFNTIFWFSPSYPKWSYVSFSHESSQQEGQCKDNTLHLCSGSNHVDYQPWYRVYSLK
jgi:hypothetical protein